MRYLVLIILFVTGCNSVKKIEIIEVPSESKISSDGTIKRNDGPENAKRMKYYNSLQHRNFYKLRKN